MKYNYLLLISIIIPSIISSTEIKRSSSLSKWRYHKKTTIIIANPMSDNSNISIKLTDHNSALHIDNKTKGPYHSSPRIKHYKRM